ncbi:MAG: DUF3857 domain-containing protein [candidate division Zixibacteria bacterium]|nr:DUF3857 domain-containing protein [candidate division Zixibacteria bacterium]
MFRYVALIGVFLTLAVSPLAAATKNSEQLVREAWTAWSRNDRKTVEQKFHAAIAADSTQMRAYLGLTMLYDMEQRYDLAWNVFRQVLRRSNDRYAYLFAEWITPKIHARYDVPDAGIVELLETVRNDLRADGLVRAEANQFLGDYYQRHGRQEKANAYYRDMRMITAWTLTGPFDNLSASGFDRVFPPETVYEPAAVYEGKNGIPVRWFPIDRYDHYFWINFQYHFPQTTAVFYANTFVHSPVRQKVQLRIGTSGALKTFLNDEPVITVFDENNNDIDTYIAETVLQPGWNRILVKCGYSEIRRCNFALRITDPAGIPLEGLEISTEPQSYSPFPKAPTVVVENFAEAFFRRQIEKFPDRLENYILLADTYLRNDKAVEAELTLREAIRRAPGCALPYHHIVEAYTRGEKFDEVATTMEKLRALDDNLPVVVDFHIDRYLENGDFENAEAMIEKAETLRPGSEWVYQSYLTFYGKKKQPEKIVEISRKAYEQYPDNEVFATTEAVLAIQVSRQFDRGGDILRRYAERHVEPDVLAALARLYYQGSDFVRWRETYERIFALQPSNPVYYEQMADAYLAQQEYTNADDLLKRALKISPVHSGLWAKLGETYRATSRTTEAQQSYLNSLACMPTHYAARRVLRELEGKPSVFSHFRQTDLSALMAAAPDARDYPSDNAVILLHDHKRVVYDGGASEYATDLLIRVLNKTGIDDFHEYWVDYNPNAEELTLERAVTIKRDGAEINADANDNHLVFKSLEEGDFIHIRYRVANYYAGRLSNHFWDRFYFSLYYPQQQVRYALLVPETFRFAHRTQNMPDEPTLTPTADGVLYEWKRQDVPAIRPEEDMPVLDDVGSVLHISSIPDWPFMVEWYSDLAQNRARSSYEIRERTADLFKGNPGLSNSEKIERIYRYITENIRYSSVSFRQSGLIPQKARDVLVNRIGDCKDVTTLGISMLREAGISAYYVLVNTNDEGYNRHILPSVAFNHCIAAVENGSRLEYLDFTANHHPVGSLPVMDMDGFSLLIRPGIKTPEYLSRQQFIGNNIFRETKVELKDDNAALFRIEATRTGNMTAFVRTRYRDITPVERNKQLTETLSGDYPNIRLLQFETDNLETLDPEVRYRYEFEAPSYVSDAAQFKLFMIPWADRLKAYEGVSYVERKYPISGWASVDTVSENLTVALPPGFVPMELPPDVRLSSPRADYTVEYRYVEGTLSARRLLVIRHPDVAPEDYPAFKTFYNTLVKEDSRQILLRKN